MLVHVLLAARPSPRLRVVQSILQRHGGTLLTSIGRARDLWPALNQEEFDFVVLGSPFLGKSPERQVAAIRALPQRPEVVVLKGQEAEPALIAAGCRAVLDPDLPDGTIEGSLSALLDRHREEAARRLSAESLLSQNRLKDFASDSPSMNRLVTTSRRLAQSDSSLLVLGETGVGKEWLARAVHAESPRSPGPFIAVNCAAVPETLLESELFGHERGAFTGASDARRGQFELAHGGTLFLDEIAEAPPHIQVKLLRFLQDRLIQRLGSEKTINVDVRLMAATNRNPAEEIDAGRLRPDLYYRLGVVVLTVPPLRERREDIPLLARSYMERFRARLARDVRTIETRALEALSAYDWPGNVRELINVMERAVLLCTGPEITRDDLPETIGGGRADAARAPQPDGDPHEIRPFRELRQEVVASFERNYISRLLRLSGGRVGEAARRAGLNPRALYEKMRVHNMHKEDFKFSPEAGDDPIRGEAR